jgi:hypothetical protein
MQVACIDISVSRLYKDGAVKQREAILVKSLLITFLTGWGCLWLTAASYAAPVTLRFDATIRSVGQNPLFDPGIDIAVGDVIIGKFTFDPTSNNSSTTHYAVQPYEAVLVIDGHRFQTPDSKRDLTLLAFNNTYVIDNVPEIEGLADTLLTYGSIGPTNPVTLPNISLDRSNFSLGLYGDSSILDVARFPQSSTTWNAFAADRQMSVSFGDNGGNWLGFGAVVGTFITVPEPSSYEFALLAFVLLMFTRFHSSL